MLCRSSATVWRQNSPTAAWSSWNPTARSKTVRTWSPIRKKRWCCVGFESSTKIGGSRPSTRIIRTFPHRGRNRFAVLSSSVPDVGGAGESTTFRESRLGRGGATGVPAKALSLRCKHLRSTPRGFSYQQSKTEMTCRVASGCISLRSLTSPGSCCRRHFQPPSRPQPRVNARRVFAESL